MVNNPGMSINSGEMRMGDSTAGIFFELIM